MTEPGKATPAVPIAPGNFDRAWNDPPQFSYNDSTSNQIKSNGPRLNRRVAYPPQGSVQPPPAGGGLPPMTSGHSLPDAGAKALPGTCMPPPPPPTMSGGLQPPPTSGGTCSTPSQTQKDTLETELGLDEIITQLKDLMDEHCGEKAADLGKRLALMQKSLSSGQAVQDKIIPILSKFVLTIQRNNLTNGEAMLTSLGADYPAECAQWIICLRHLIADMKAKQQVSEEGAQSSQAFPYFVPVPAQDN